LTYDDLALVQGWLDHHALAGSLSKSAARSAHSKKQCPHR
jgi:hypothetical protein